MKRISTTSSYYRHRPVDLLTEYTICESFSSEVSPYMTVLEEPRSYGALLGQFLRERGILVPGMRICEAGGGYGSLMRGMLEDWGDMVDGVVMVDLSPYMLKRQKKVLSRWSGKLSFINGDVLEVLPGLSGIDLVIVNEVMGDLPTWVGLDPADLPGEVAQLIERYGLHIPPEGPFNFNLGAVRLVESLSMKRGMTFFLSEHSSDPIFAEDMSYLGRRLNGDGYPREIILHGHSEFTIRFSHLDAVARAHERETAGGPLTEIVGITDSPRNRAVFIGRMTSSDEQEILYELLDHIREYRWMLVR